jgi:hypothetical protein
MPILYIKDLITMFSLFFRKPMGNMSLCVQGQKTLMGRGDIIKETLEILILKMLKFGMKPMVLLIIKKKQQK